MSWAVAAIVVIATINITIAIEIPTIITIPAAVAVEEAAAAKVYKLDRDQENLTLLGVILCVILFKWFSQCHLFPF